MIGLSSFVPDVDYSSYGISPFNLKITREDYFQPEFDNLGRQPVSSAKPNEDKATFPTFDLGTLFQAIIGNTVSSNWSDVLGYSLTKGALRLLDLLGYGDLSLF